MKMTKTTFTAQKPFHPQGLAGTKGGVVIIPGGVQLVDPETESVLAAQQGAYTYRDLYLGGRLFDLFGGEGSWYVGRPWTGAVRFIVKSETTPGLVVGEVFYPAASLLQTWWAQPHYGERVTWEIQVTLPPDHRLEGDIALQVALGRAVYEMLESGVTNGETTQTVTNLFEGFADLGTLPFLVNRLKDSPLAYLENVYGWLY